jgi:hypothetical protein
MVSDTTELAMPCHVCIQESRIIRLVSVPVRTALWCCLFVYCDWCATSLHLRSGSGSCLSGPRLPLLQPNHLLDLGDDHCTAPVAFHNLLHIVSLDPDIFQDN